VTYPLTPTPSSSSRLPSVRSVLAASPLAWSLTAHALGRTGAIPFRPYAYQTAILRDRSLRRLILKARQVGISQAVAIEARWAAEYEPQSTTLFISRNEKLAAELVRYTRRCAPEQVGNPLVRDGSFSLEWANCMGMCDQGPAMLVNETVYTQLTPDKVHDIVEEYRSQQEGHVTKRQAERAL